MTFLKRCAAEIWTAGLSKTAKKSFAKVSGNNFLSRMYLTAVQSNVAKVTPV